MKIALVILHADPARGGAERYTLDLAAGLHARRVDVPLAALANYFNPKRRRFAAVERSLLDHPDTPVVLCLSDYVKATVRRRYPSLSDHCLATLFNAVDLAKFDPAARPNAGLDIRSRF